MIKTNKGLSAVEAADLLRQFGPNALTDTSRNRFWLRVWDIVREPMFVLLAVACVLYFVLGDWLEAIVMLVSILFVTGIELYQENKSEKAINALRVYTEAKVKVMRDGKWLDLPTDSIVPGDLIALEEGDLVPADGRLVDAHDVSIDESARTGESLPVEKTMEGDAHLFQGTMMVGGSGQLLVEATGNRTELAKLGKSIDQIDPAPTPLQIQIRRFVKQMGWIGGGAFVLVFALNYWMEPSFLSALLFSLTLAMSILPQEIPVAFSSFMGLGAFRMIKEQILAKQPKTVESLGSATVICLDKTGTITENQMSVAEIVDFSGKNRVLEWALWASEPTPFDPMEKAILDAVQAKMEGIPRANFQIIKEYPLAGRPPMMTHVWENAEKTRIVACKGGLERILAICKLPQERQKELNEQARTMAAKGFRVLAIASASHAGADFPALQDDFNWELEGLLAFFDPPKKIAKAVFAQLRKAGIRVLMITGDQSETASNIAQSVGIVGWENTMEGTAVMELTDAALQVKVGEVQVFARMFPEAKLRVVQALQASGEIVAMSGDGVNDGPALKAAHIGVAMGKKGSEIAKSAASLVLLTDNLGALVTAVSMGRRIYTNLRKAIRYVISIHLPIVLTVLMPLVLGWTYPHILLPLHVIFLELVMDPTAAIAFENEPAERDGMLKPPRSAKEALFTRKELWFSLLQGFVIALFVLAMYPYAQGRNLPEAGIRACMFSTLVFANLFLTLVNRSFVYPVYQSFKNKNRTIPFILGISCFLLALILYVPFLASMFKVQALSVQDLGVCFGAGLLSVGWFELVKLLRKKPMQPTKGNKHLHTSKANLK